MRMVNVYLPGGVWVSYLLVGGLFTIIGFVVLGPTPATDTPD